MDSSFLIVKYEFKKQKNICTLGNPVSKTILPTSFQNRERDLGRESERETEKVREKRPIPQIPPYTNQHIIIILENHTLHVTTTL